MHPFLKAIVENLESGMSSEEESLFYSSSEYDIYNFLRRKHETSLQLFFPTNANNEVVPHEKITIQAGSNFGSNLGFNFTTKRDLVLFGFKSVEDQLALASNLGGGYGGYDFSVGKLFCPFYFDKKRVFTSNRRSFVRWITLLVLLDTLVEKKVLSRQQVLDSFSEDYIETKLKKQSATKLKQKQYYVKSKSLKFTFSEQKILAEEIIKTYLEGFLGIKLKDPRGSRRGNRKINSQAVAGFQAKDPLVFLKKFMCTTFPPDSEAYYLNNLMFDEPSEDDLDLSGEKLYKAGLGLIGKSFDEILRTSSLSTGRRLLLVNSVKKEDLALGAFDQDPLVRLGAETLLKKGS